MPRKSISDMIPDVNEIKPIEQPAPAANGTAPKRGARAAKQPRAPRAKAARAKSATAQTPADRTAAPGSAPAGLALSLRDQRYLIRVKAGLLAAATKKYNEALTEATDLVAQLRAQGVSENFLIAGFAEVDLDVPEPETDVS